MLFQGILFYLVGNAEPLRKKMNWAVTLADLSVREFPPVGGCAVDERGARPEQGNQ